jgi:hypothetical protein
MSSAARNAVFSELVHLPLPDGWRREPVLQDRYVVIGCPAALCTIDTALRGFRGGGYVTYGPLLSPRKYTGRGWVARLHADAVAWLREQEEIKGDRR